MAPEALSYLGITFISGNLRYICKKYLISFRETPEESWGTLILFM
jgi:hypothetical protein